MDEYLKVKGKVEKEDKKLATILGSKVHQYLRKDSKIMIKENILNREYILRVF